MKFFIVLSALVAVALAQQPIGILREANDIQPDGSFQYSFETENGISANAHGEPRVHGEEGPVVAIDGQYSYTAEDGTPIQLQYVADENGFQPQGAHIPTPPPVPAAILRALEYNAAHPESH